MDLKKEAARQGYRFRLNTRKYKEITQTATVMLKQAHELYDQTRRLQDLNDHSSYQRGYLLGYNEGGQKTDTQLNNRIKDLREKFFQVIEQRNTSRVLLDKAIKEGTFKVKQRPNENIAIKSIREDMKRKREFPETNLKRKKKKNLEQTDHTNLPTPDKEKPLSFKLRV